MSYMKPVGLWDSELFLCCYFQPPSFLSQNRPRQCNEVFSQNSDGAFEIKGFLRILDKNDRWSLAEILHQPFGYHKWVVTSSQSRRVGLSFWARDGLSLIGNQEWNNEQVLSSENHQKIIKSLWKDPWILVTHTTALHSVTNIRHLEKALCYEIQRTVPDLDLAEGGNDPPGLEVASQ